MTPEQEILILKNLPLVSMNLNHILSRSSKRPMFLEWLDLEQSGREGLIKAVLEKELKPEDIRWTTFASWYIRSAIRNALEGNAYEAGERQIRLPHRIHIAMNAIAKATEELTQQLNRQPCREELATHLGWSESVIEKLELLNQRKAQSFDELAEDQDGNTLADLGQSVILQPEEAVTDPIIMQNLRDVLNSPMLTKRELEILFRKTVGDESFQEIGNDLKVARQRIQQIQARALHKIKQDSRLRRHQNEDLFGHDIRTAHLYRFANRDRSDAEWWAENTTKLEWTEERRRQWARCGLPRQILGFGIF